MNLGKPLLTWLETRSAVPAYAGWVLMGLTACFWLAAANTMAGWLYVLSGVGAAILLLSAAMPMQTLKGIEVRRSPLAPLHVGETLSVDIALHNLTAQSKGLLMIQDQVPRALGQIPEGVVEAIAPHDIYRWHYNLAPERRGRYQWKAITLRTGAPLGLFWSRRVQSIQAEVLVYPRILPLTHCPLLEEIGPSAQQQFQQVPISRNGSEGSTRSLRPYRTGDPMRMVHWRSSARFNTLRVREMEVLSGGPIFIVALDTQSHWYPDAFEQAVMAAASLFSYGVQNHYAAQLWTPQSGLVQGKQQALEILAQIEPEQLATEALLNQPAIWLTSNPERLSTLPMDSRFMIWPQTASTALSVESPLAQNHQLSQLVGVNVDLEVPLQIQLQAPLTQSNVR